MADAKDSKETPVAATAAAAPEAAAAPFTPVVIPTAAIAAKAVVATIAGGGGDGEEEFVDSANGKDARFAFPHGIAVDAALGQLLVADGGNHRLRAVDLKSGAVMTTAGDGEDAEYADGPVAEARFNEPVGVCIDPTDGSVVIADADGHRIRRLKTGVVSTIAGTGDDGYADGAGAAAQFNCPKAVAFAADGRLLVLDADNNRVRAITPAGVVQTVAGTGEEGGADGAALTAATFEGLNGLALNPATGHIGITSAGGIRVLDLKAGTVATVKLDGRVKAPTGIAYDSAGNAFVGDSRAHVIWRIDAASGAVERVAGTGEMDGDTVDGDALTEAAYQSPVALAIDPRDGTLLVCDQDAMRISRITFQTPLKAAAASAASSAATASAPASVSATAPAAAKK